MSKTAQRKIEVYADWLGLTQPALMGILHAIPSRGKEIFSFVVQGVKSKIATFLNSR